jgi:hypothetical protein
MALNMNKPGGNKNFIVQANIEAGVYPARLVQLIDLGLQPQKAYQGKDKAPAQEIMLTYELVDEFMKDEAGEDIKDKPRWISETLPFYGLFADKAKSTHRYNAFDPKGEYDGDFAKALGSAINIAVVNNSVGDKIYDNIGNASTMRPRDAQQCPDLVNPAKVFDLDSPDMGVFNSLPEWIQKKIQGNLNYAGSVLEAAVGGKPKAAAPVAAKDVAKAPASKKAVVNEDFDADESQDNPY